MKTNGVAKKPASEKKRTATTPRTTARRTSAAGSRQSGSTASTHESRRGLMSRVQDMIGENEETIHLVLEIAAMTLERTEMSRKKKRISKAVLNLLSEILDTDYEEITENTRLKA